MGLSWSLSYAELMFVPILLEGRIDITGLGHDYPHGALKNIWLGAIDIYSCEMTICSVTLHLFAFAFPSTLCLTNKGAG